MIRYIIFFASILSFGCKTDPPNSEDSNITTLSYNTEEIANPTHPYMKNGLSKEKSDRAFHNDDCAGYRAFYNIDESVLTCEDDDSVYYKNYPDDIFRNSVNSDIYFGYREDKSAIYYSNKANIDILFLNEHVSFSNIIVSGVGIDSAVAASCPSIFKWNYKQKKWNVVPELFVCNSITLESIYEDTTKFVNITYSFVYINDDGDNSDENIGSIIAKEEVFKIKASVWSAESIYNGAIITEDKISLIIPTTSLRKDMFNAYLEAKN